MTTTARELRLSPLGGVGRFGRNCLLVEDLGQAQALVVDCGARFAGPELPGFDVGLPDLERLAATTSQVLGYVITHGHEDHIGGLPFALRERPAPVWCTRFTSHFVKRRCERAGVAVDIQLLDYGVATSLGPFEVTLCAVSHSIPGAASLLLKTPVGTVVHSGDFRIDSDPVFGPPTDLETLTRAGDDGVACLLADSTGALSPGANPGERAVAAPLLRSFVDDDGDAWRGAVVVALFASHLQRLALLVDVCRRQGRRLLLLGRGLKEALRMALAEAAFAPDDVLVSESDARALPRHLVCVAVTGSQGEPDAMLARLARALAFSAASSSSTSLSTAATSSAQERVAYPLQAGDRVVFSARVIPGNEAAVQGLLDTLTEGGIDIVAGRHSPHVSGHGHEEDLRLLLAAVRPEVFVALHGGPPNLRGHGALARRALLHQPRVVGLRDGHSLLLVRADDGGLSFHHRPGEKAREPAVQSGQVSWFPSPLAKARVRMHQAGVLVVVVDDQDVVAVEGRGLFPALAPEDELLARIKQRLRDAVLGRGHVDDDDLRAVARMFWRAQRTPPEVVVVPLQRGAAPEGRHPARQVVRARPCGFATTRASSVRRARRRRRL
jgi:ribonuclease J